MPRRLSTVHITYAISSGDQSTSCPRITGFGNPVSSLRSALSWLAAALAVGNSAARGCTLHRRPLIGSYAVRLADWASAALLLIIRQAEGVRMDLIWILLGVVGWGLGLLLVLALMRMAADQDRAARHVQKRLDPLSDITITKTNEPPKTGG